MKIDAKNVVKNIVEAIFPEKCRGCGEVGGFLCERCKKYISENMVVREIIVEDKESEVGREGLTSAEFLGFRDEILGEMVEECKYAPARGLAAEIAEVVWRGYFEKRTDRGSGSLTERDCKKTGSKTSGAETILVPMPTSRKHVRERGFDHMDLICREVERLSGGRVRRVRLLRRKKDTVQVGASEKLRRRQAKEAVGMDPKFLGEDGKVSERFRGARVVLIDDVWTTGASLTEAGRILAKAGVRDLTLLAITKNRPRRRPAIRRGEID